MKKMFGMFLALVLVCTMTSCTAIGTATAGVNWYKIAAYGCVRLCKTLNKKADEKDKELEEHKAVQAQDENGDKTDNP